MKKFLRKINRGLLLGIVLLIGVTGYVIVDKQNFKNNETQAIANTVTEYLTKAETMAVFDPALLNADRVIPQENVDQQVEEAKKIAEQYFVTSQIDIPSRVESTVRQAQTPPATFVTEKKITDVKVTEIKKTGPNSATAKVSMRISFAVAGTIDHTQTGLFLSFFEVPDSVFQNSAVAKELLTVGLPHTSYQAVELVELSFEKKNGKWRISIANEIY